MTKLNIWWHNKKINPMTKRRIKKGGKVFKKLLHECLRDNNIRDNYTGFHNNKIDPLIKVPIPLIEKKPVYEYKYCWEPLTGEIIDIDPRGPLFFDPDTLIHYFYVNRLKYLWNEGDGGFTGSYGDGLGNGPDFNIPGRGLSLHYYLFRLPLSDAYCDNLAKQQITVGPVLTYKDIEKIYNLSKTYGDNYMNLYGRDRPNLLEIYELYHNAILNNQIDSEIEAILSKEEIEKNKYLLNKMAVDKLKII